MTIKRIKYVKVVLMFASTFLFHFLYNWVPNPFFAIFTPVNESIFEHMKLIASAVFFIGLIEYICYLIFHFKPNNLFFAMFLEAVLGIIFYLTIYYLIGPLFHYSMTFILILLFITFVIIEWAGYFLLDKKIPYSNAFGIIGFIVLYILFGYFTYKPLHTDFFFDTEDEKYGINEYVL